MFLYNGMMLPLPISPKIKATQYRRYTLGIFFFPLLFSIDFRLHDSLEFDDEHDLITIFSKG